MKLFVRGSIAAGLMAGFLFFTGCASEPKMEDFAVDSMASTNAPVTTATNAPAIKATPLISGEDQTNSEVAHLHVGETVSIIFSGPPDPIEPHEEIIKEDGNITLSLIGPVKALGKTAGELQNEIHDLYVPKYYVRLNVVVKPGDLIFYVRGEVKQPGRQLYVGETSVTKAITSAGDFTDFASHKVTLIRANGERVKVNVDKALEDPTLDAKVYPGDQIYVPRRIF